MLVLGIETSCDETAVAVVERVEGGGLAIRSHLVFSQVRDHAPYEGVVPEVAARAHISRIRPLIGQAVREAGVSLADLSLIAVTSGPGLIGGLVVGLMVAKGLAMGLGIPLVAVNHLAAHVLTPVLAAASSGLSCQMYPYAALLVSGGHTQVVWVEDVDRFDVLASTRDDALGEVFDKVARMLGLGYPGGPILEKRAKLGSSRAFSFPRPMFGSKEPSFSFSGLKTAVRQTIEKQDHLDAATVNDIAASFQQAAVEAVCDRLEYVLQSRPVRYVSVVGGVAANGKMRAELGILARKMCVEFGAPPHSLCTDNAAMVAFSGLVSYEKTPRDELLSALARARWPLSEVGGE